MYYYFDESGNWQELNQEKKNLVIGAVVVKDEERLIDLKEDLESFKSNYKLNNIHMTELNNDQKNELHNVIIKYLEDESIKGLFYLVNPEIFYSQTQVDAEDVYISVASQLLSNIAFGDDNVKVEYDMKFHYAYPQNILDNMKIKHFDEFTQMQNNFLFRKEKIQSQKERIKKILKRYNLELNVTENIGELYKYVWAEFRLKVELSARMREKFRERTLLRLEQNAKKLGLADKIKLKIEYKHKNQQSIGVYVADILSNIVYHNGLNAKFDESKEIYKYLKIKEIKNGEI